MSGTNDKIVRVNYAEIITSMLSSSVLTPIPMGGSLIGAIIGSFSTLYKSRSLKESKPTDIENIKDLIKAGKEQEVSELKIEMDKSTAVGINVGELQKDLGPSVTIGVKTENHIVLEVKYK